jgi:hypothetical protein
VNGVIPTTIYTTNRCVDAQNEHALEELEGEKVVLDALEEVVVDEHVPHHHKADAERKLWRSK